MNTWNKKLTYFKTELSDFKIFLQIPWFLQVFPDHFQIPWLFRVFQICSNPRNLVISINGDTIVMQSISITSRPSSRIRNCNKFSQFGWTCTRVITIERLKMATFWRWAKGSREAASEGPTVLCIHFYNLSNNSK